MFYNQTHHFLSKKFKIFFFEKIPQNQFYCIFKKEFFKIFQIFEIFRKPRAFGARNNTFGGLRPPKVGAPPPASRKKIWETTPKNRREQGFHSGVYNYLFTENLSLIIVIVKR